MFNRFTKLYDPFDPTSTDGGGSCLRIKDIIIQVLRFLSVQINERNFPTGYSLPMVVFLTEEDFPWKLI